MTCIADLDARGTAAALQAGLERRRRDEVEDLLLVLHWADLHSTPPHAVGEGPAHRRTRPGRGGGERLVDLGGEGTPGVRELAVIELGVARAVHPLAARHVVADALDLRHRLPGCFAVVCDLRAEVWVGRKIASATRHLSTGAARLVDDKVAAVLGGHATSRVLEVLEAAIIEADAAAHAARVAEAVKRRYAGFSRADDTGMRTFYGRMTTGDAHDLGALLEDVADLLAPRTEYAGCTRPELLAEALTLLGRPEDLADLREPAPPQPGSPESESAGPPASAGSPTSRPGAVIYVHLHQAVLDAGAGIVRVEGLGPHTLRQLRRLLGGREVTVKPVIDLHDQVAVTAYEHPAWLGEQIHLRYPGDAFPHACRMSRHTDLDHLKPYVPPDQGGPPGQTSAAGTRPISRTPHRAKTHLGYTSTALDWGSAVLWSTPHKLYRIVDHTGTRIIDADEARAHLGADLLHRALARITHQSRTGTLPPHHTEAA